VIAYRAPSFSITRQSLWALPILVEEGFTIDSSIFPIHHDRYGVPDAPTGIRPIATAAGSLWEFPPTVVKVAGVRIPASGGGYFRLYPLSWTLHLLARFSRTTRQPFMFYVHPWEIDFEQPRLRVGSFVSRFRHYVNLSQTEGKLNRLLEAFHVGPIGEAILPFQRSATITPVVQPSA
jgi:polysaccharide deacetylase family protein (PEP-CTERM system associated)